VKGPLGFFQATPRRGYECGQTALETRPELEGGGAVHRQARKTDHRLAAANGVADPPLAPWYKYNVVFQNSFAHQNGASFNGSQSMKQESP